MGTSGAYSGSGGSNGRTAREAIADHLGAGGGPAAGNNRPAIDPRLLQSAVGLLRPRDSTGGRRDGPSGAGGGRVGSGDRSRAGGGAQRSVAASARTAGRAAAAAYAYRTGDATTLQRLGLDYAELRGLGDDGEVARRIVSMACGVSDSTIPDHEQRIVAADIAEWIFEQEESGGRLPTPEEIVRQTIASVIAIVILTETGNLLNQHELADVTESDIRDFAEAKAGQAALSVNGASEEEISRAVEDGIETLRSLLGDNT